MDDLKEILLVSRLIMSMGSGLPMWPKHAMPDWSANGMITLFLRFWEEEEKRAEVRRCEKWDWKKNTRKMNGSRWKGKYWKVIPLGLGNRRHCWSKWFLNVDWRCSHNQEVLHLRSWKWRRCWCVLEEKVRQKSAIGKVPAAKKVEIFSLCSKGKMEIWCAACVEKEDPFERWFGESNHDWG